MPMYNYTSVHWGCSLITELHCCDYSYFTHNIQRKMCKRHLESFAFVQMKRTTSSSWANQAPVFPTHLILYWEGVPTKTTHPIPAYISVVFLPSLHIQRILLAFQRIVWTCRNPQKKKKGAILLNKQQKSINFLSLSSICLIDNVYSQMWILQNRGTDLKQWNR